MKSVFAFFSISHKNSKSSIQMRFISLLTILALLSPINLEKTQKEEGKIPIYLNTLNTNLIKRTSR